jgi:hypothetical protein
MLANVYPDGGTDPMNRKSGWRHTAEARQKMSDAKAGRQFTPEHREKLRVGARRFWDRVKRLQAAAEADTAA